MNEAVIVAATRTAVGSFRGALSELSAVALGARVIETILTKTGLDPATVDEVILGQVLTAGQGQNVARQAAIHGGLPVSAPAFTVNKVCGSGLKSVQLAAQAVRAGDASAVLAGGMESMSNAPHVLLQMRSGIALGHGQLLDSVVHDGLWDAFENYHMGVTAENLAQRYSITREQQDEYAVRSHERARAALNAGYFADEITPVTVTSKKAGARTIDTDEQPRETSVEALARLRPVFREEGGTVTAGNASSLNDGAALVMVVSRAFAQEQGLPVLARVVASAATGVEPATMGLGPVSATRQCLNKAGWTLSDLDLIEANEAFAAQVLAVNHELQWDQTRVNVNGGAIALGHPIGASGCRLLVSLLHEMQRREVHRGLVTLCVGGGQGVAMALERP
ncbi:acetyl-CoA C-acetyltransferase [Marinimicrobium sp. LS-A18]|uniref:acetyl-CoA C-acetyltransferase n=1 Tax=Marinimicrobium sp. LS-A18 TaxID=1381596 RepID=UPI00046696E3|nr:acetyl-CoA C-acetyltransferase [Marinimicrobium sp. LS-A18]